MIVLQSDHVHDTRGVVVAPLVDAETMKEQRLYPVIRVEGRRLAVVATEIAAAPRKLLKERVGNEALHRGRIVAALDLLLTGV